MSLLKISRGFTLIELLVTLSIVALLLSVAVPRYIGNVTKAEEAVLKQNLFVMRDAIQKYYADQGRYPAQLDDLVKAKYLLAIPGDPVQGGARDSWVLISPPDAKEGVFDVRSSAKGRASDNTAFGSW